MTVWLTRADWGARPPNSVSTDVHPERGGFAIHYSGANSDEQALHANCGARVRAIQSYHMGHNRWADIAYSWLVCRHGYMFEGRGWRYRTAAQGTDDGNDRYLAICFLGDDTPGMDDVTDLGREAIRDVITRGWAQHGVGKSIRPHSSFKATSCPGDQLRAWIAAGLPEPTPAPGPSPQPPTVEEQMKMIRIGDDNHVFLVVGGYLEHIPSHEALVAQGLDPAKVETVNDDHVLARLPRRTYG